MQLRMKTNNCGELNLSNIDQEVTLSGWVDCVRDLGGMIFIELRDRTGYFQLVSDPQKNPDIHKMFEKIRNEWSEIENLYFPDMDPYYQEDFEELA